MRKSEKKICRTIFVNSGLLLANHSCARKTAVLKNYFSNLFSDFQKKKNEKEGNPRPDISALKSVSDFAFDHKSQIRILNLSTKYKFITLPWTRRISRLYFRRSLGSGFVFPRVGGLKSVGIAVIEPQPAFPIDCSDFTSYRLRYNNRLQETQASVFLVWPPYTVHIAAKHAQMQISRINTRESRQFNDQEPINSLC